MFRVCSSLTATVKGVQPTVLVSIDMESLAIDLESGVLDPVRIATWNTTQVRMLLVDPVVGGIVETKDDVTLFTVDVLDEKVGDGRAVRDELSADALARDRVLAIGVDASAVANWFGGLGEGEERQGRESG